MHTESAIFKKLDFVIIGASKSGTTTLSETLRKHPEIFIPPNKGGPIFTCELYEDSVWQNYAKAHYSNAPANRLWGKVTPRYMEDLSVPESLCRHNPSMRLIAILRNPIDRTYSHYRQQVRRAKENRPFEKAISETIATTTIKDAEPALAFREVPHFHPIRSFYCYILKHYLQYFSRGQLLVIFLEELEKNPEEVISKILAHLDLDPTFKLKNANKKYHVGGTKQRFPKLIPQLRKVAPAKIAWHALPTSTRASIRTWYTTKANVISEQPRELPAATREELKKYFERDVQELIELTGERPPWFDFR